MSLYVIEDRYGALRDSSVNYKYAKSLQQSKYPDGHIVEMVPAKPKVKVSQEEADVLETAKNPTTRPSFMITEYSNSHKGYILGNDLEDRLMSAYVIGWTVEKPKLFLVKVPHTDDSYFYKIDDEYCNAGDSYHLEGMTDKKWFTIAEIEHYGLGDCQKVVCADSALTTGEVTDDEV